MCKRKSCNLITLGLLLFFFCQYSKVYAYEYYSYSNDLDTYSIIKNMPERKSPPGYADNWDMSDFVNRSNTIPQSNYNNNSYSGSSYFIYSPTQNPSYCIPGSSYAICH